MRLSTIKWPMLCFVVQTGTLTEDGLDVRGVIEPREGVLSSAKLMSPGSFQFENLITECLASCHSLISIDGK